MLVKVDTVIENIQFLPTKSKYFSLRKSPFCHNTYTKIVPSKYEVILVVRSKLMTVEVFEWHVIPRFPAAIDL